MTAPVCNAGRCSQILGAIAERDAGLADRLAAQLRCVLEIAFDELGLTAEQQARRPDALRKANEAFDAEMARRAADSRATSGG